MKAKRRNRKIKEKRKEKQNKTATFRERHVESLYKYPICPEEESKRAPIHTKQRKCVVRAKICGFDLSLSLIHI